MSINATSTQLWADKAADILKEKHVNTDHLKSIYTHIYFPWDINYDAERLYFSLRIQQRPLFIVKPISTLELELILNYVDKKALTIRICGGRHSTQLLSPDVLVDMIHFNEIGLDNGKLVVGAGATQGQANEFLFTQKSLNCYSHFGHYSYGRGKSSEFPGGSAQSVGVAGISCVGGIGVLRRTFGLTIDSILSIVVTVPPTSNHGAKTIVTSSTEHPDLFWALCGGGANNFGIVSQITYELFEVNAVVAYTITWPFDDAKKVIDLWDSTAATRPNTFTEELDIFHKDGTLGISVDGSYVVPKGQSIEEATTIVKNTLAYLGGDLYINPTTEYSKQYKEMVKSRVYNNFLVLQGVFTDKIDSEFIVESIKKSSKLTGNTIIEIELLGGKIKEGSGSFGFRDSKYFSNANCNWSDLIDSQAQEQWLNDYVRELVLVNNNGVYLGFPIPFTNIPYTNEIYYGKNYNTLKDIKNIYDPKGILSYSGTL